MTPRLANISILVVLALTLPAAASAAGGGGGGGGLDVPPPPTCSQDTWECGAWSRCSLQGKQNRNCALTSNCPTAETPRPDAEQSCTPECTSDNWECQAWSVCNVNNKQTRACALKFDCPLTNQPKPSEEQSCLPGCNQDEWECGAFGACENDKQTRACTLKFDCPAASTPAPPTEKKCTPAVAACAEDTFTCTPWSQCQADGRERRKCALKKDCAKIKTAKPEEIRVCPGLKCGHLPTLKERVTCRLNSTPEEMKKEFSILYFPEYCRAEETPDEQRKCIAWYQKFGTCWQMPLGAKRIACAKQVIKLDELQTVKTACRSGTRDEQKICRAELKKKTKLFVLFGLYELEVEAERRLLAGQASLSKVANFEVFIENKKVELEKTETLAGWRQIIGAAKARRAEF